MQDQAHQRDQAHPMTLDERREFVIQDIVNAEENFEEGTVSGQLLSFFNFLADDTDTFDVTMIELMLEFDEGHPECHIPHDRDKLRYSIEERKELVQAFLNKEV